MSERAARHDLVRMARRLDAKGVLTATDGNLSILLDSGDLVITPSGSCKGELSEGDLIVVSPDGSARGGRASSEIALHRVIYETRPDVKAIVHAHPPYATAYAVCGLALDQPILSEAVLTLGEVPVVPYAMPTGPALAESVRPFVSVHQALLLRFHGAVTYGTDIKAAGYLMETVEHVAHIDFARRSLGSDATIADADVVALRELRVRLFGR